MRTWKTHRTSRLDRVGQRNGPFVSDFVLEEGKRCKRAIGLVTCGACHVQIIQNDALNSTRCAARAWHASKKIDDTAMSPEFHVQRSK